MYASNQFIVLYNPVFLNNGAISYHFKLGDFGLGRNWSPSQEPSPFPPALNSPHQNPNFSTRNYDHHDDLYGVGYIMWQLQSRISEGEHPDKEYRQLILNLMNKRCDVTQAHAIAEKKFKEMIARITE